MATPQQTAPQNVAATNNITPITSMPVGPPNTGLQQTPTGRPLQVRNRVGLNVFPGAPSACLKLLEQDQTVPELLVFTPNSLSSHDCCYRLMMHQFSVLNIRTIIGHGRNAEYASHTIHKRIKTAMSIYPTPSGNTWTPGGHHNGDYTPMHAGAWDDRKLSMDGYFLQCELNSKHGSLIEMIPLVDLAIGVVNFPSISAGDGYNLTRCVRFALANTDLKLMYPRDVGYLTKKLAQIYGPLILRGSHYDSNVLARWRNKSYSPAVDPPVNYVCPPGHKAQIMSDLDTIELNYHPSRTSTVLMVHPSTIYSSTNTLPTPAQAIPAAQGLPPNNQPAPVHTAIAAHGTASNLQPATVHGTGAIQAQFPIGPRSWANSGVNHVPSTSVHSSSRTDSQSSNGSAPSTSSTEQQAHGVAEIRPDRNHRFGDTTSSFENDARLAKVLARQLLSSVSKKRLRPEDADDSSSLELGTVGPSMKRQNRGSDWAAGSGFNFPLNLDHRHQDVPARSLRDLEFPYNQQHRPLSRQGGMSMPPVNNYHQASINQREEMERSDGEDFIKKAGREKAQREQRALRDAARRRARYHATSEDDTVDLDDGFSTSWLRTNMLPQNPVATSHTHKDRGMKRGRPHSEDDEEECQTEAPKRLCGSDRTHEENGLHHAGNPSGGQEEDWSRPSDVYFLANPGNYQDEALFGPNSLGNGGLYPHRLHEHPDLANAFD